MKLAAMLALASGCTFSIKIEATDDASVIDSSSNNSIDARTDALPTDAAPPIDAGPDAMPMWTLLETIVVPCDGTEVLSTNVLAASVTYRLRSIGECVTNDSNNSHGDAEYVYNQFGTNSSSQSVDCGLAINDTTPDVEKLPDWGAYQSSHNYTATYLGLGARIIAKFHDPNYSNNSGQLTLAIDHLQ